MGFGDFAADDAQSDAVHGDGSERWKVSARESRENQAAPENLSSLDRNTRVT